MEYIYNNLHKSWSISIFNIGEFIKTYKLNKVADSSQGGTKGSLFNSYYTEV